MYTWNGVGHDAENIQRHQLKNFQNLDIENLGRDIARFISNIITMYTSSVCNFY